MAFTGVPILEKISDTLFRITGVSLAADASGTIGFTDKTISAEVDLSAPSWQPFKNADGDLVTLQAAIRVTVEPVTDVSAAVPISIVKAGTDHGDFSITLHNDNAGGGQASGDLEIYVGFNN